MSEHQNPKHAPKDSVSTTQKKIQTQKTLDPKQNLVHEQSHFFTQDQTIDEGLKVDFDLDFETDIDPSFVTVAYSLAGLNLGYAMYDGDNGGEETQMGVGTSMMGLDVGITFATADLATDVDYTRVSASKGMGAASFGIDFTETDSAAAGGADDSDAWQFTYVVGF